MNTVIKIFKFILMIILTVSIISMVFINLVSSTVLNKEYILGKLDETFYYMDIREELENNFENYIGQSGFEEEVLQNIVTEDKIKEDTGIILSNIYDGTSQEISTEEIEQNLRTNIENSLDTDLTATQEKMVDQYVKTICDQYLNTMSHTSYENNIYNVITKINEYIGLANRIIIISIVISALLIVIFDYKNIVKALSHLGISLFTSGVFGIIVDIYINTKVKIDNIMILNDAISEVIRNVLNSIFLTVRNQGIILLVIGAAMILIGNGIYAYFNKKQGKDNEQEIMDKTGM